MTVDCVIDISHHNGKVFDFGLAKASGVLGVIHKASQGSEWKDDRYAINRIAALDAGLRWGSYHFGTDAGSVDEAEFYLTTVGPQAGELLCLDFEMNPAGPSMTRTQAKGFVGTVYNKTGVWPVLYGGSYLKSILGAATSDSILSKCPLWLAQYGPKAIVPSNWVQWSLWQYTDGVVGPDAQETPGIGYCDRSRFFGEAADFDAFWDFVSVQTPTV
jgi:lysozyme